jgi:putative ABC transport system substrate-binding protein
MKRREFMSLIGGAAAASAVSWPLAARAQQGERVRRIGVLMALLEHDPEAGARMKVFREALAQAGWSAEGVKIDYRFSAGDPAVVRKQAAELVALSPDAILAHSAATLSALRQATGTIPIVFVQVADPLAGGFVDSLARPGRNITGFTTFENSIAGTWLELLKTIAPRVARVAVIRDAAVPTGAGQLDAAQATARSLGGVELRPVGMRNVTEVERGIGALAGQPNGGLIVTASSAAMILRERIIALAARHRLPAIYFHRSFAKAGGLISHGPDVHDQYRRAAGYVGRILKGEPPAGLPVEPPAKYETVINLATARTLGLEVPPALRARAEGIE